MDADRRRFPRLKAPVLCRPAGLLLRLFAPKQDRQAVDISLGGMRIYSDEVVEPGALLSLELFLPAGHTVACKGQVAWVEKLPEGSPAVFDVGVRFTDVGEDDRALLSTALAPEG